MNVIGSVLTIAVASDPTLVGRRGTVVMETMKTLVLATGSKTFRVEKAGTTFELAGSRTAVSGGSIAGRLEDRWGSRQR